MLTAGLHSRVSVLSAGAPVVRPFMPRAPPSIPASSLVAGAGSPPLLSQGGVQSLAVPGGFAWSGHRERVRRSSRGAGGLPDQRAGGLPDQHDRSHGRVFVPVSPWEERAQTLMVAQKI